MGTYKGTGCTFKLLCRFRYKIIKRIWLDLVAYVIIFFGLNLTYRYILNPELKKLFEQLVEWCSSNLSIHKLVLINISTYVLVLMETRMRQYTWLPEIDSITTSVSALLSGQDEKQRQTRRTVMRHVSLSLTMVLSQISPCIRKRFSSLDQLVHTGLLLEEEKQIPDGRDIKYPELLAHHCWPIHWALKKVKLACEESHVSDELSMQKLSDSFKVFSDQCEALAHNSDLHCPTTCKLFLNIFKYSYILMSVVGRQWVNQVNIDGPISVMKLFPFRGALELVLCISCFKVFMSLCGPFGNGEEDLEIKAMLDPDFSNFLRIVDEYKDQGQEMKAKTGKSLICLEFQLLSAIPPPAATITDNREMYSLCFNNENTNVIDQGLCERQQNSAIVDSTSDPEVLPTILNGHTN